MLNAAPSAIGSREDLDDLARFIVLHAIRPQLDSSWDFDDAEQAYGRLLTRSVFGKVVIKH